MNQIFICRPFKYHLYPLQRWCKRFKTAVTFCFKHAVFCPRFGFFCVPKFQVIKGTSNCIGIFFYHATYWKKSRNLFKFVLVLLSASVEWVGVSRMRDFSTVNCKSHWDKGVLGVWEIYDRRFLVNQHSMRYTTPYITFQPLLAVKKRT